jgi:hypothetical protein
MLFNFSSLIYQEFFFIYDWLIPLCIMFSRLMSIVACVKVFAFYNWIIFLEYVYYTLLIHLMIAFGFFRVFTVVKNAAVNIGVQGSVESLLSFLLGIYLGVALLECGNLIFNFLRNYFFCCSYTIMHFYQQCIRVHILTNIYFLLFFR